MIPENAPMLDSQPVVRLVDVSVCYQVANQYITSYKEYLFQRLQGKIKLRPFYALRELNLTICRGEVLGVIGHNGAGKSTLLKLMARVLYPTTGRVWVRGRVAPLLDIGAGFHPELTGRENIFLNGTLLGFTRREMQEKFNQIVEFAELGDFIEAPLRTYSSGMMARLGFAVATQTPPDILLVDEVLAVGDEAFQKKSRARIQSFQAQGATILLVSHQLPMLAQMCQQIVWLDHGRVQTIGRPDEVIQAYQQLSRHDQV
jgi:ABC-type polysaccharide/polyol phosphate transport system ATPase subunit